jgi:hypothetical protein
VDSNHRPSGYEPDELPLLHAALGGRTDLRSQRGTRQYLRRCGGSRPGSGWDGVGPPRSTHAHWFRGQSDASAQRARAAAQHGCLQGSPRPCAPVACTCHHATSAGRSPSYLLGGLPAYCSECPHLGAPFPLRCFQRFGLPAIATEPAGRPTTPPPAGRPRRSSRTKRSSPQDTSRPSRIETELSHDVLNPARVPHYWANSPTLGTDSSPRMRRADIEVPNPAGAVNAWAGSACYPRGSFYPLSYSPSTWCCRITKAVFPLCAAGQPCSQAPFCLCTLRRIAIPPEGTIARLRYRLGGVRPRQTTRQPRSRVDAR